MFNPQKIFQTWFNSKNNHLRAAFRISYTRKKRYAVPLNQRRAADGAASVQPSVSAHVDSGHGSADGHRSVRI